MIYRFDFIIITRAPTVARFWFLRFLQSWNLSIRSIIFASANDDLSNFIDAMYRTITEALMDSEFFALHKWTSANRSASRLIMQRKMTSSYFFGGNLWRRLSVRTFQPFQIKSGGVKSGGPTGHCLAPCIAGPSRG
jgi:hypothetical protein